MEKVDANYNILDAYLKMKEVKEHHRTIEEIVCDLKKEFVPVRENSFLIHAMRLMIELGAEKDSPIYTPAITYEADSLHFIDVHYSIDMREESVDMDGERWESIAILLNEIEMTYFINIGFPRCRNFIFPRIMYNACFKCLIYNSLQSLHEEQKSVRGTVRGLLFYKETNKIYKNALFLEFLAYLYFVAC